MPFYEESYWNQVKEKIIIVVEILQIEPNFISTCKMRFTPSANNLNALFHSVC